jgi:uncharacterized Zn-finger protein
MQKRHSRRSKRKEDIHEKYHTEDKPYVCGTIGCGGRFKFINNYVRHEISHSQEEPFVCRVEPCIIRFASTKDRDAHEKEHNADSLASSIVENDITCRYCKDTFTCNAKKKDHERSHTGEKVHVCHCHGLSQ